MYRTIPVGSKICHKHEMKKQDARHKRAIREMKPGIDTRQPATCSLQHLRNNMKREQLLEDRYMEIDRENRILLQKMSDVMRKPAFEYRSKVKGPVSMTKDARKHEMIRITQENQAILRRIQTTQPVYNHQQWEESYRRNELYLRNACEYPMVLRQQSAPTLGMRARPMGASTMEPQDKLDQLLMEEAAKSGLEEPTTGEEDLQYVLKEGKKIGGSYYLVEMATDGRTLTISAYDGDTQQTLELLMNEKNHRKLHRDCEGDYSKMAERLSVEGDRLILKPTQSDAPAVAVEEDA
jgi:E3 ubiquitin-protein ligase TRIP12